MYKNGFSLVELAVVLVILGLLTGGILAGRSLIRASELRSITVEAQGYKTAIYSFRDKYFALPGDMPNATRVWGDQATGTNACADAAIPNGTPGTCNGNGDGWIGNNGYGPAASEATRAWQHLANASLIEGTYTGYTAGAPNPALPGTNVPTSKLARAGWGLFYRGNAYGSSTSFIWRQSHNFLQIGNPDANGLFSGVISPSEAWNVDTKYDDGFPETGRLLGTAATSQACVSPTGLSYTDAPANRVYDLTQSNQLCTLYFKVN